MASGSLAIERPTTSVFMSASVSASVLSVARVFALWLVVLVFGGVIFVHPSALAQDSNQLVISANKGRIELQDNASGLSPEELAAVRTYAERRIRRTPFQNEGRVQIIIKAKMLEDLRNELRGIDIADSREVDRAMTRVWADREADRAPGSDEEIPAKVIIGQQFTIDGTDAFGDVVAIGSKGVVRGRVGNLVMIGSDVEVAANARVSESLVVIGSQTRIDPNALVRGEEVRVSLPRAWGWGTWHSLGSYWGSDIVERDLSWRARISWTFSSWLAAVALGVLYIYLVPAFHDQCRRYLVEHRGVSLGLGMLGFLAVTPVTLLLILTILGIILVPIFLIVCAVLVALGHFTVGAAIGGLFRFKVRQAAFWELAAGLLVLKIIGLVPWIGTPLVTIATAMGLGAVLRSLIARSHWWKRGPPRQAIPPRTESGSESEFAPA